ncbi:cilia- and flagella-associated protein 70 isoform X2 [Sphaerodactylus townsendi]|uniref:cilia- and flagella-associated protein 70 isoform X2 n=1 Tax=Sphaerodactylus townsendi TaxID=933632 RepID=UPI002025F306|nr:cilia- and flagella-associated protein 70 isoform X2 [Sphaerodactylus townsendi]
MAASPSSIHVETTQNLSKPVNITVLEGHDLKGLKVDTPLTFVRVEFNSVTLGDTPKVDVSSDGSVKYNFSLSFDVQPEGPHCLDDLAHKPLLFTVIEVLPKEKKQKEEKTVTLGQAVLDLLPLLQGSRDFKTTLPLYPIPGSPLESLRPDAKCSLNVIVTVQDSLLSLYQLTEGNLLRVTVEGAYAVPEAFVPTGPLQNYMVGFLVPAVGEKECPFVLKNGTLKIGGERELVPRPKKWPVSNILAPGAQNISDSFVAGGDFEEEDGELTGPEDREIRILGETFKKRIMWDLERRCYLDPGAVNWRVPPLGGTSLAELNLPIPKRLSVLLHLSFRKRIADCRYWPVEIARMPSVTSTKGKAGKADKGGSGSAGGGEEESLSFHGVTYVNMVPLLYPGVKRIRGAFRVVPYYESDVFERTRCTASLFRDGHHLAANRFGAVGLPAKSLPRNMKEEKPARENTVRKLSMTVRLQGSETAVEAAASMCQNVEGQHYADAGTFLVLEFALDRALVPKRLQEELTIRVQEMIPPHPQLPRKTTGAQKAVEDYHSQVISIAETILEEYHELFGRQLAEGLVVDHQNMEEQKCHLNYELNSSGKYFAFKEQLKHAVVKIVREKYLKTTAFENLDQLQAFLSELYVYLVDQMHVALNQVLTQQTPSPPPPTSTTSEHLRLFAREAQTNGDYVLASTYYQERLARDRQDIQSWIDYGAFCLLTEENLKAQECFREAVALNHNHVTSLLLCGIMAVVMENYEEAEVFFEDATCLEPNSVLAWTILGLFYDIQENGIRVEMAFRKATKLLKARQAKEKSLLEGVEAGGHKVVSASTIPQIQSTAFSKEELVFEDTADIPFRLRSESTEPTHRAEEEGAVAKVSTRPSVAPSKLRMPTPKGLKGRAGALLGGRVPAIPFVHKALAHELVSPLGGPSCEYYLVLGQTYLLKKDYDNAMACLEQAVQIDYLNPDVWAQKGHCCYLTENFSEAKDCYERTISFVSDASDMHSVYLKLGSIYLERKEHDKAKNIFLLASMKCPSCLTWMGVGKACYRLKEMVEAEDALSEANALNNNNAEVWAYLALVCMAGGRQLEAEQSYKYAVKLGLDNEDLLRELKEVQLEVGFGDPSF